MVYGVRTFNWILMEDVSKYTIPMDTMGNFKLIIQGFIYHINRYTPQKWPYLKPEAPFSKAHHFGYPAVRFRGVTTAGCHPSTIRRLVGTFSNSTTAQGKATSSKGTQQCCSIWGKQGAFLVIPNPWHETIDTYKNDRILAWVNVYSSVFTYKYW